MSAHVLLILLNELRKRDKMRAFNLFFATSLINLLCPAYFCILHNKKKITIFIIE